MDSVKPSDQYLSRKTTRLRDYDYSQPGFYFITICTQDHRNLLGEIVDGEMQLNAVGETVECWWQRLPERYHVQLDCYVVMPNHFHGVVVIPDEDGTGAHIDAETGAHIGAPLQQIVRWFKTMTTNEYLRGVKTHHWRPFEKRLWQRNYYEHVIRGDKDLAAIREYICNNPLKWELDSENPENICPHEMS